MRSALLAAALLLLPAVAWALPAPKSEAELMQASDLVVDAQCVTIRCEGPPKVGAGKTITAYRSTLFPSKSYKGGLPNSIAIVGELWTYSGPPPVGGWHQEPVPKGWAGKLYLERKSDGTYTKVWWNADQEDKARSKPLPLPSCTSTGDGGPPDAAPPDAPMTPDQASVDQTSSGPELGPMGDDPAISLESPWPIKDDPMRVDMTVPDASASADSNTVCLGDCDGDGCGCGVAGHEPNPGQGAALLLLIAGLFTLHRRRQP